MQDKLMQKIKAQKEETEKQNVLIVSVIFINLLETQTEGVLREESPGQTIWDLADVHHQPVNQLEHAHTRSGARGKYRVNP
jgi:hypothetical protein